MDLYKLYDLLDMRFFMLFASFILPGFIIMKIIRLKIPNKDFLLKDMVFEAIAYSLLNVILVGWLPYLMVVQKVYDISVLFFVLTLISIIFAFVVFPFLLSFLYVKIVSSKAFTKRFDIQMPTAWDWVFSQRPCAILLVHLKNGDDIIGYFGENSYATSFPNEGSIYLEKLYTKNEDGELEAVEKSNGILISDKQYISIEFFEYKGELDE